MKKFKVAQVQDKYNLIINGGAENGILPNQRFIVYVLDGPTIINPDTSEVIGKLETVKGTGIVSFLEDKWCRITSDRYRKATEHDKAIRVDTSFYDINQEKIKIPFDPVSVGDLVKPI